MPTVVKDSGNGLDKVVLETRNGASAEVYLHGGHITSFKTASGKDVIFVSKQAVFKPPKAIRGGVPVCFPQFGQLGRLGQHGFARNMSFEAQGGGDTCIQLVLEASGLEDMRYPHSFELKTLVQLTDDTLVQELTATNTGEEPMEFTCALHTYFRVSSIDKVRIEGLEGVTYTDSLQGGKEVTQEGPMVIGQEVDRVYLLAPDMVKIVDDGSGATVELSKSGFPDAVVWNPWVDKSKGMADFGDDEYKEMLCIEPAVAGTGAVKLAPGESWSGRQTIKVSS